ncbi:MAG: class I SAM-dependent methyltransferase [Bacteroidota bacterium]
MVQTRTVEHKCPSCGWGTMDVFYEVRQIPVHSVLLLPTREEAVAYPKGDIELGFCTHCGFISNIAFDPSKHEYSEKYEETQGFSSTFSAFHKALAERLIDQYDLHGKDIIEIGCGKGEFLTMLCEMGNNRGVGFDPAYVPERNMSSAKERIRFVQDFYSERYAETAGDVVICKMTLEHIPNVAEFIHTVRRSIGDRKETVVFFQIPDTRRVLKECAFWDIYYEHCSYFSPGSLARLFRSCGFDVMSLGTEYDDQYLMIEAKIGTGRPDSPHAEEESPEELQREVLSFVERVGKITDGWRTWIRDVKAADRRAVIWGGGSKGVAFLTKLGIVDEIPYAVDINPYKRGTYMAGTGQEIVLPDFLQSYGPDSIIVMNPIYCDEIRADLDTLNVHAEIIPIHDQTRNA